MTQKLAMHPEMSPQELPLKIYQETGFARSAALQRISSNPQTDITILGMSKIFWSDFRAFGSVVLDLEHGTVQNPSSLFTSFSLIAGAILDLIV
jgi:hypothetical protein